MVSFSYEFGFEEVVDLLADRCVSFRVEPVKLLDDEFLSRIDIEPVNNHWWIDFEHVFVGPSEYVFVFPKEVDKLDLEASRMLVVELVVEQNTRIGD